MSSISRKLPDSNVTRRAALNNAKNKKDLMGASNFLTAPTTTRLDNSQAAYAAKWLIVDTKRFEKNTASDAKDITIPVARQFASHFLQVFNLGVERGVFPKAARTLFGMTEDNPTLPEMISDEQVLQVCSDIVLQDAVRVAAGGTAMAMPSTAQLNTVFLAAKCDYDDFSTIRDEYDQALEDLAALNPEVDKVIKKVWDEVETFYNEESPESMRDNARVWGVVYVIIGVSKTISGTVKDANGVAVAGILVRMKKGTNTATSADDGSFSFTTVLMGDEDLWANQQVNDAGESEPINPLFDIYTQTLSLTEDVTSYTVNIVLANA